MTEVLGDSAEKVKGLFFLPWVKIIRSDKSGVFNRWIQNEDKEFLTGRLFASSWYPFASYERFVTAVAESFGRGDEQTIYSWGYDFSLDILTGTYKIVIMQNQPLKSLEKCVDLSTLFFDFGKLETKAIGEKSIELHISDFPPNFKYLYWIKRGWYARLLVLCGAEKVESKFTLSSWQGAPKTVIEYTFS